jgi:hypothetical protein
MTKLSKLLKVRLSWKLRAPKHYHPNLCYHKNLSPVGACRLCMVEIEKWRGQVAACTTQVSPGMVIHTETDSIIQSRRVVLELLLHNYFDSGYAAQDGHQNEFMGWVEHYRSGYQWYRPSRVGKQRSESVLMGRFQQSSAHTRAAPAPNPGHFVRGGQGTEVALSVRWSCVACQSLWGMCGCQLAPG